MLYQKFLREEFPDGLPWRDRVRYTGQLLYDRVVPTWAASPLSYARDVGHWRVRGDKEMAEHVRRVYRDNPGLR